MTGCFSGSLDEFAAAVGKTHADNKYGRDYRAAVAMIREIVKIGETAEEAPDVQ